MTTWDVFFDKKIKLIAKKKVILDVGGAQPFQKGLKGYEKYFTKSQFITVDFNYIYQPSITADIHSLPIKDNTIDGLICKAVLEHVYNPFEVVAEMYRVAKKNAVILVYVPFLYAYHGNNLYKDYFRYTHDGLEELFKDWRDVELQYIRGYCETVLLQMPGSFRNYFVPLARKLDTFIKTQRHVSGYYLFARK